MGVARAAQKFVKEILQVNPSTQPPPASIICIGFRFSGMPIIESSELFAGGKSAVIRHHEEEYTLETTRNGKLILKK